MKNLSAAVKVGVFVALILVASYILFKRVHEGYSGARGIQVYALFKDGAGLVAKSQVVIAGLPAGKISGRRIQNNLARVDLFVDKKHKLYSNAVVYKKALSMMGQYYLEIDPGTPYSPNPKDPRGPPIKNRRLKNGDRIMHVVEAVGVNDILPQIKTLVSTVNDLMAKDVRSIIQALKRDISGLLGEVKKLASGPVADTMKNANRMITDIGGSVKRLTEQLNRIASDVRPLTQGAGKEVVAILRDVKDMTGRLRQAVKPKDPDKKGIVDRIERIAAKLEKSVDRVTSKVEGAAGDVGGITKDVKKITGAIASGKGTVGTFITDESLAVSIKETVQEAGTFIRGLTGLQTIVGLRSEYNVLANSLKTYVTIRLQPSADKYYLIELIDDPRGNRTVTQTVTRTDNPNDPPLERKEEVKVTDAFRVSFMFAKRVGFATFRMGIKENTGGLGLDLEFFNKRLIFKTDVFDFQANLFPRLKASASWMFYQRLYIVAGVDDMLNSRARTGAGGGRDYFIGAMLMFNDADLKALMMFAGSAISGAAK
jgi:phospholipid/cholesterol/gamma-HCH transport system substrate-binding protein